MAFSDMYIGDSQTMAAEAAVLGVPSIRFNDFVGELSYLEELEHKYGLTKGIKTSDSATLIAVIKNWVGDEGLKSSFAERRSKMLENTIDVTREWVSIFKRVSDTH
jgi:predicted glycosyltransferase